MVKENIRDGTTFLSLNNLYFDREGWREGERRREKEKERACEHICSSLYSFPKSLQWLELARMKLGVGNPIKHSTMVDSVCVITTASHGLF